jgi:hypothetical protein
MLSNGECIINKIHFFSETLEGESHNLLSILKNHSLCWTQTWNDQTKGRPELWKHQTAWTMAQRLKNGRSSAPCYCFVADCWTQQTLANISFKVVRWRCTNKSSSLHKTSIHDLKKGQNKGCDSECRLRIETSGLRERQCAAHAHRYHCTIKTASRTTGTSQQGRGGRENGNIPVTRSFFPWRTRAMHLLEANPKISKSEFFHMAGQGSDSAPPRPAPLISVSTFPQSVFLAPTAPIRQKTLNISAPSHLCYTDLNSSSGASHRHLQYLS